MKSAGVVLFLHIEVGMFGYLMCEIRIGMISTRNRVQLRERCLPRASCSYLSRQRRNEGYQSRGAGQ
jgi:hypothetical protein